MTQLTIREPEDIRQDCARKVAPAPELDGDEIGFLVAKVAEIKRQR